MLERLTIKHLAIIDDLSLELNNGLICLTGETGAGKSLILDSLALLLALRKPLKSELTPGANCEISATFEISKLDEAKEHLAKFKLLNDAEPSQCLIRRVLELNGDKITSFNSINDHPCSATSLKELGALLIRFFSQQQQFLLFDEANQLAWLDNFSAQAKTVALKVASLYHNFQLLAKQRDQLEAKIATSKAQADWLDFQLKELENFNLDPEHLRQLQDYQREASHQKELLSALEAVKELNAKAATLTNNIKELFNQQCKHANLEDALSIIESACINHDELERSVQRKLVNLASKELIDPETVEAELSKLYDLARKHHCDLLALSQRKEALIKDREESAHLEGELAAKNVALDEAKANYQKEAAKLTKFRLEASKVLENLVNSYLKELAMPHAKLTVQLTSLDAKMPKASGLDAAVFWLKTNLGIPSAPLSDVASGGECSRVNLAMLASLSQFKALPTLLLDEIDSGIGGVAAEAVARLLNKLSQKLQIICITHLAQVAVHSTQHLKVAKTQNKATKVSLRSLQDKTERVLEIARMLSGSHTTKVTLAHAKELLSSALN